MEARYEKEYDLINSKHMAAAQKERDNQFSSLATPTAEANYNASLFVKKYFLTKDGRPDPERTPRAIVLLGLVSRSAVHAAAGSVSGLETCSGGMSPNRSLVIGWDRGEVWRIATRVESEQHQQLKRQEEEEWEESLQEHRNFVDRTAKSGKRSWNIHNIAGSYIIRCTAIETEWPADGKDMLLDIHKRGVGSLLGSFNFGVLDGVMLFAENEEELTSLVSTESKMEEDSETYGLGPSSGKRKVDATQTEGPRKRLKGKANHFRRVALQWRGEETGESVIQLDPDNSHRGYLDFSDNACTKFVGKANLGFIGEDVEFEGFKVDDKPSLLCGEWESYSEAAYESARVGRWR